VGPKVLTLRQIATGGNSVPRRGGQPSVRTTESSTQAVLRGVYAQVLGTAGYAGERLTVEEIKLENGDITLREFVRQVARSTAFRRRYWSGLYICKAIEVMHRRLLGRPTFGRWEINAYFDVAARRGFYGVVDAMIESPEYSESFGEDTVPYERFITPADRNARRVPALRRPVEAAGVAAAGLSPRPDVAPPQQLRTVADLVPRNLPDRRRVIRGSWSARISGGDTSLRPSAVPVGPGTIRTAPEPSRRWSQPRWQPGRVPLGSPGIAPTAVPATAAAGWRAAVGTGISVATAQEPGAAMAKALRPTSPQGFSRRRSLSRALRLSASPGEGQIVEAIEAVYRQLLNRVPFRAERLLDAESQFRDGQLTVGEFVAQVAGSDLFQQRLLRMAPLRAASAAYLALLGRAAQPAEVSRFLATRAGSGQRAAIAELIGGGEYARWFGQDGVPYLRGMATSDGLPLTTVNRTAQLYAGNAGLTPAPRGPI
jgi:phycobilisome core-membrane linker protein